MEGGPGAPPRLWIDGDGCPVVLDARRIAARHGIEVTLVSGPSQPAVAAGERFTPIRVTGASEAADDYIASHAGPADLVVTDDLPLADRCLKAGASVITSRGLELTDENIGSKLARRDLGKFLRELGQPSGGPSAFSGGSRSQFKMTLHEVLQRLVRRSAGRG